MIYKNVFNHYFWLPLQTQTCEMFVIFYDNIMV